MNFILFDILSSPSPALFDLSCSLVEQYNWLQTTDYDNINELIWIMINNERIWILIPALCQCVLFYSYYCTGTVGGCVIIWKCQRI